MRPSSNFTYRPDIDGLRAIAILSVLAFHTLPAWVPGGFTGVDVFFVISGYLISGIILNDLQRGVFSFVGFYCRRIRRIFPALLVVLAFVWAYGWFELLPGEYQRAGKHIAAGAGFVANLALYKEVSYFDTSAELKPLLHLWSLGIEEQFYILWPLFLFLTWRLRANQWMPILAVASLSFVISILVTHSHPEGAFYLPQARFWELLVGALLAHADQFDHKPWATPRRSGALAWLGVLLLAGAFATLNRSRLFPGWWATLPVAGAALLIAAGPATWINRHLLGNRLMIGVGLISYPLYLWHWPLLSLLRIVQGPDLAPAAGLSAAAVSVGLACLIYRYIELPIQSFRPKERVVAPLLAGVFAMGLIGYATFLQLVAPRSAAFGLERILRASQEHAYPGPHLSRVEPGTTWLLRQGDSPHLVLFFGDSNLAQYYPRVDEVLSEHPFQTKSALFATQGGCAPIPGVREKHHPQCDGFVARTIERADDPAIDTIVIAASWYGYFVDPDPRYSYYIVDSDFRGPISLGSQGAARAFKAFEQMVRSFVRLGKTVYLVLQMPVDNAIDPQRMIKRSLLHLNFSVDTRPVSRAQTVANLEPVDSFLRGVAQRTGSFVLDPLTVLCATDSCPVVDPNGNPIYLDGGHLRPSYVRNNIRFLDALLRSPDGTVRAAPYQAQAVRGAPAEIRTPHPQLLPLAGPERSH